MKRALTIVLLLIGAAAGIVGLLFWDAISRADAAIRDEDERLARDIAAFRSRVTSSGVDSRPMSGRFLMMPMTLEQGVSEQQAHQIYGSYLRYLGAGTVSRQARNPYEDLSLDECVSGLAMHQERLRERGFTTVWLGHYSDARAFEGLRAAIVRPGVGPEQLQRVAQALDRLSAARPLLREILEAQRILEHSDVLRILHFKADPVSTFRRGPGWRELFSWRILVVRSLRDIDERYRELRKLETSPIRSWDDAVAELPRDLPLTQSACSSIQRLLDQEAKAIALWEFTRVVVALQWFQADHGKAPTALKELVPKYVSKIPLHPYDGTPLDYKNETLISSSADSEERLEWTIKTP